MTAMPASDLSSVGLDLSQTEAKSIQSRAAPNSKNTSQAQYRQIGATSALAHATDLIFHGLAAPLNGVKAAKALTSFRATARR